MRVTVIHNTTAGDETHTAADLVAELRAAGHDVAYASTTQDWRSAVQDPGDLVIAAGGDGTVAKVALALADGSLPCAVLPLGTANNFAHTLGQRGSWRSQLNALFSWPAQRADLGVVRCSRGDLTFIEGVGFGVFADLLAVDCTRDIALPKSRGNEVLRRDRARLRTQLSRTTARSYDIEIDDDAFATSAILVAVLNTRSIGPKLELATSATPFDGMLDLVVIAETDRPALDRYLAGLEAGRGVELGLSARQGRRMTITMHDDAPVHIDDRSCYGQRGERIVVEVRSASLPVLVPPD